jgi:thioredoxin 1
MANNMKELNTLNFHDSIENGISLVKFWTTWCGPCKVYSPIFNEFAEENQDINCFSVNAGSEEDLVSEFNLISVPMTLLFKDGKHIKSQNGIIRKEQLLELLKSC